MTAWSYLLFLALIFGTLQVEAQEEECEEITVSDVIDDTEDSFTLTKDICLEGHKSTYLGDHCCDERFPEDDKYFLRCIVWLLFLNPKNEDRLMRQMSRLAGCFYGWKKYIKDDENLDFDKIQADAANLGDPLKEKYMVDLYTYCGCRAKERLAEIQTDSMADTKKKMWFMSLYKPYFLVFFSCSLQYMTIQQCPYFEYYSAEADVNPKCQSYAQQCEGLVNQ